MNVTLSTKSYMCIELILEEEDFIFNAQFPKIFFGGGRAGPRRGPFWGEGGRGWGDPPPPSTPYAYV